MNATHLPVSADLERGFGDAPEPVAMGFIRRTQRMDYRGYRRVGLLGNICAMNLPIPAVADEGA